MDALVDASSPQVDFMNMRNAGDEYTVTIDGVTLTESSTNTPSIGECLCFVLRQSNF